MTRAWAGGASAVADQEPFDNTSISASVSERNPPTATHEVVETHETLERDADWLRRPRGRGRRCDRHVDPDRTTTMGCSVRAAPGSYPTATHDVADGHDSPCTTGWASPLSTEWAGSGRRADAQPAAVCVSAIGTCAPLASSAFPTATHAPSGGQDRAVSEAPGVGPGTGRADAAHPSADRVSTSPAWAPAVVAKDPTPTHSSDATHDSA